MGRYTLRIVIVLGVLVTLLGGTGVFAVFTDRATTGTNSVTSGSLGRAADIQIAAAAMNQMQTIDCVDDDGDGIVFDENLVSAPIEANSLQPGMSIGPKFVCLQNVGSSAVALKVSTIDIRNEDLGCTGDEAAAGDTDCQPMDPGELLGALKVRTDVWGCDTSSVTSTTTRDLAQFGEVDIATALPPGQQTCVAFTVQYPSDAPANLVQQAQSDRVQWRFAFDATAS